MLFPYFRLLEEGLEVDIAAPQKGHFEGEHGYGVEVEKTFDDVHPEDYDLLLIPGGSPDGAPSVVRKDMGLKLLQSRLSPINLSLLSVMVLGSWLPQA